MAETANRWFICEDCTFVFQTHSKFSTQKKKPFCPNCGENHSTGQYTAERTSKQRHHIKWTDQELEILNDCRIGKLMTHQAAIIMGRSTGSVREKLRRIKKSKMSL